LSLVSKIQDITDFTYATEQNLLVLPAATVSINAISTAVAEATTITTATITSETNNPIVFPFIIYLRATQMLIMK
jgi:hypothetical protein